ncbi:hypothetical protein [Paenibacillus crassostreae]|nr:hypothetical protein [Paenibacillus crassostreae]
MSKEIKLKTEPSEPMTYQIMIKGHLGPGLTYWFEEKVKGVIK